MFQWYRETDLLCGRPKLLYSIFHLCISSELQALEQIK